VAAARDGTREDTTEYVGARSGAANAIRLIPSIAAKNAPAKNILATIPAHLTGHSGNAPQPPRSTPSRLFRY